MLNVRIRRIHSSQITARINVLLAKVVLGSRSQVAMHQVARLRSRALRSNRASTVVVAKVIIDGVVIIVSVSFWLVIVASIGVVSFVAMVTGLTLAILEASSRGSKKLVSHPRVELLLLTKFGFWTMIRGGLDALLRRKGHWARDRSTHDICIETSTTRFISFGRIGDGSPFAALEDKEGNEGEQNNNASGNTANGSTRETPSWLRGGCGCGSNGSTG